jgi:hypothetical protein
MGGIWAAQDPLTPVRFASDTTVQIRMPPRTLSPSPPSRLPPAADESRARAFAIGFFLVPEFPMMAFASAIEPLRAANRLSGESLFGWNLYSRDGKAVRASNGIDIAVHGSVRDKVVPDLLLVCAGTADAGAER